MPTPGTSRPQTYSLLLNGRSIEPSRYSPWHQRRPSLWPVRHIGFAAAAVPLLFPRRASFTASRGASSRQTWSQPFRLYYLDHHNNGCGAATRPARVLERCCRHIRPPPARCARMLRRPARLAPMSQMRSPRCRRCQISNATGCIPFSIYTFELISKRK